MNKLQSEEKYYTTQLGLRRIKRNLNVNGEDVLSYCVKAIQNADLIIKEGKNTYAYYNGIVVTIHSNSNCIITAHQINANVRIMQSKDYEILPEFLYHAIFVPEGYEKPPRMIIQDPKLAVYINQFGDKPGDYGVVSKQNGRIVGAAWTRIISGYGHINENTPELAIAVLPEFRGYGIGTKLMGKLFGVLKEHGYTETSLSVQKENPAAFFYQRLGYKIVKEKPEEYLMIKSL